MTFQEMKKWALDHLKKQMKDEPKESDAFKKSIDLLFNMMQKSRGFPVGTIKEWKGKKYKKMGNGNWVRYYDKSSRGSNQAIAAVMRKIEACKDETELYNVIQANIGRFSDANGIPLPEVEKIHKASDEKKGKLNTSEGGESEKYDDKKAFEEYKKLVTKDNPTKEESSRIGELVKEHFKLSDEKWPGGAAFKNESKVLSNGKTVDEVREQYGIKAKSKEEKKEAQTLKQPSKEKQQKAFDDYAKKCEKEGHKKGRGDSLKPHNYTVNGEPYVVTTDARTMLMKKGSFDDPDPNSKGISDSSIEKVSEDHGQKVSVQDDIDEQIKNCPPKAYLNGENIVPAMMFGDYVIDSKYLKQAQKIFGSLKDCKITGSGDTTSSVRLEKGDYVFVIMPMRDVSPNIIINASDSQRSELQQKKAEADKKYKEEKAKREAEYQARQEQWRKEAEEKKAAEERAKTKKDNEIKAKYHGYFDGKKGLDKSRAITHLEKKYNFDGKVMSVKEFVEQAMKDGKEITSREVDKLSGPSRHQWNRMNGYQQEEVERKIKAAGKVTKYGINGYEFPKTVVDYAKYYKENMNNDSVKKSFAEQVEEIRKSMIV